MSKLATNTQTTNRINSETLPELLRKINALPDAGSGGNEAVIEALNITENGTYNATETVDGYAPITVNVPIPDGYIHPEGTKTITENGTYDVTEFASAVVEVPTGGGDDTLDKLIEGEENVELTSNAMKVGYYAFHYAKLAAADFPKATSIGNSAFRMCTSLTTANFPSATEIGDHAFYGCSKLATVDFPKVTSIWGNVFESCSSLVEVDFPLVPKISSNAFRYCRNLTTADFPSVTSIGNTAFENCSSLTALILRSETMATLSNTSAFNNCTHFHGTVNSGYNPEGLKDGYFYVPRALVDSYKTATNWATFETQFRILEDFTVDGTITGELDLSKI